MKLSTTKLLPETKRLAKQQAAARGMFLYEYLAACLVAYELLAEIAKMNPYTHNDYDYCLFCSEDNGKTHYSDCLYALAQQLPGMKHP